VGAGGGGCGGGAGAGGVREVRGKMAVGGVRCIRGRDNWGWSRAGRGGGAVPVGNMGRVGEGGGDRLSERYMGGFCRVAGGTLVSWVWPAARTEFEKH